MSNCTFEGKQFEKGTCHKSEFVGAPNTFFWSWAIKGRVNGVNAPRYFDTTAWAGQECCILVQNIWTFPSTSLFSPVVITSLFHIHFFLPTTLYTLHQVRATRGLRATFCSRYSVMLHAQTLEIRKYVLTLSLANRDRTLKKFWKTMSCFFFLWRRILHC